MSVGGSNGVAPAPRAALPLIRGPNVSPKCGECPLGDNGRPSRPVPGIGPRHPKWIALGEAPGQTELQSMVPFVGPSGRLFNATLQAVGVQREDIWVANSILCKMPPEPTEGTRNKARECCAPRLAQELAMFAGKPVLALGATASQALLGKDFSVAKMAGSLHQVDGRDVIPTLHPAAILRGGAGQGGDVLAWNLTYDAAKVDRLARGAEVRFTDDVEWSLEGTAGEALLVEMVKDIRRAGICAVDTETVSKHKAHEAIEAFWTEITAISLATPERGVSVAWGTMTPRSRRLIGSVLGDSTIAKVFHNAPFDVAVLTNQGYTIAGEIHDTILLHHNAFPGLAHDLQRVATQFFAIEPWKAEFRAGEGTLDELLPYNARDSLVTSRLVAPLQVCVKRSDAEATYALDCQMAKIAARMHLHGIPISKPVNAELATRFQAYMADAQEKLLAPLEDPALKAQMLEYLAYEQAKRKRKKDAPDFVSRIEQRKAELDPDDYEFVFGSGEHVAAFLKAHGIRLFLETKGGRLSTKKEILEALAHKPIVKALLDYRENQKAHSTFVRPLPIEVDRDWRLHVVWSVNKISGRWGSQRAVQNWPEMRDRDVGEGEAALNLRRQVVAPKGKMFTGWDFSGIEARQVGLVSGCKYILETFAAHDKATAEALKLGLTKGDFDAYVFKNGPDLHTRLTLEWARRKWDESNKDKRKALRNMTKRLEYGFFYGAAETKLHQTVSQEYPDVRYEDVVLLLALFRRLMPEVAAWHDELIREVTVKKEVRAVGGRRRCYPLGNVDPNEIFNLIPQASTAHLMNTGLSRLIPRLDQDAPGAELILQLHDGGVVEHREDDTDKVRSAIKDCIEQEMEWRGRKMWFPIDLKSAKSWSDL